MARTTRSRHDASARVGLAALAIALVLPMAACTSASSGNAAGSSNPGPATAAPTTEDTTIRGTIDLAAATAAPAAPGCDFLDPKACLLPFPSDYYTVADPAAASGRRVHLDPSMMPVNKSGTPIDPAEWNRNDGFSPGTPMTTYVPGVDLGKSGVAPVTDISASLRPDAPIVVLDTQTGERQPYWAEMDTYATSDANRLVLVHPAVALAEGHHIIVAMRGLQDGSGTTIAPADAFRAYRDRLQSNVPEVEARRPHMNDVFATLAKEGVRRADLYLAWDFTVSSTRSLSERMLHIRDDALAALPGGAPAFKVVQVDENIDDRIARKITGTFQVPNYLTGDGSAGQSFSNGPDGLPQRSPTDITETFTCIVPKAALDPATTTPARASLYGHGLLGSDGEVSAGNVRAMANEHDIVFCGTKWLGLSVEDIGNAATTLGDLSTFKTIPDRLQEGILAQILVGRLLISPQGFTTDPAFQRDGKPVVDTSELFYDGNSLGSVVGGAQVAVSPDVKRAVLGVPGMDFALLLPRSHDFDTFAPILNASYTDEVDRAVIPGLIQMLWDRGETNGYAQHLTRDFYPNTPQHTVLMHVAYGDFQVAPASADMEARTIRAHIHEPALDPGRSPDKIPYWGIDPIDRYPYDGSAVVIWDSGTPTPPLTESVPRDGRDPHEDPRNDPAARKQKSEFLLHNGTVVDVCNGQPCKDAPAK